MSNAIDLISSYVYDAQEDFQNQLVDKSINFEREAGFAIQILCASDYSIKTAQADRQSVINAVTNIAAIGISLNPAKKQAYLVPRKGKICLDISYMGLIDLAVATGSILWAQAALVHEQDAFSLNGFDKPPTHTFNPFSRNRGDIVGAYVVVKTADGDYLTDCMSREEIDAIMNRSESVKSGKSSPWKTDYGEMAKKTVVKRAYKYWPKTDRLDQAVHYLNTEGGEGLEKPNPEKTLTDAQPIIDGVRECNTEEALISYWREHNGKLANQRVDHDKLKAACARQKAKIKSEEATIVEPEEVEQ